jgi:ABC-type transport system involved in multi-copper enzyme maturation permease subunit
MRVFLNLYRAEWLKLRRGPLPRVLLGLFLLLLLVQMSLQYLVAALASGSFGGVQIEFLPRAQTEYFTAGATLPGAFGVALGHANGLGGAFAIVLAAGALGNEYGWGTLRTVLARQPSRALFLLAKAAALMTLLALALVGALVLAGALGLLFGTLLGAPARLDGATLLALPPSMLRSLYVALPYVLLTLMCTVLGRATLAGIVGGLLYLAFEAGLGGLTLTNALGGIWKTIYNLTSGQNINTLVVVNSRAFGLDPTAAIQLDPATLPSPAQAILLIAIYSAAYLASTIWLLRRRDIGGPA